MATHISHSELLTIDAMTVTVRPPETGEGGKSYDAMVEVRLQGMADPLNMRHYWSFEIEDAERVGQALLDGAKRARDLS
ncbi:hypothetical protein [Pseudonocardia alni]|uniref:hypothetical protein n=1 Tax=Pseudonocardia alni TaxID=33907 RepID=UPI003329E937